MIWKCVFFLLKASLKIRFIKYITGVINHSNFKIDFVAFHSYYQLYYT